MPRIFLYEHITACGIGRDPGSAEHSLFVEGRAMFHAIREDFAAIPGVEVLTGDAGDFGMLAAQADWSFVIAPETDGVLLALAEQVLRVGGRLLGPTPEAIALTSDKFALYQHWKSTGVPTPETVVCLATPANFPAVVKRRDGAGSEGMRIVQDAMGCESLGGNWIAQPRCEGIPASAAFIVSPGDIISLPPAFQCISTDGTFQYRGGLVPIRKEWAARLERLARRALRGVPGLRGYVGVDLLLGRDEKGGDDLAIEINPRLTTSYAGLKAHFQGNLAEMMLEMSCRGSHTVRLQPRGRVAFTSAGQTAIEPAKDHWDDPSEFSTNRTFFL